MLHMGCVYKKCSPGGQWMLYFQILLVSAYGFSMESTKNHYRFLFFLTPTSILSTIPIGAASKMRTGSGRFLPLPPTPRSPSPCPGGRFQRTLSSQSVSTQGRRCFLRWSSDMGSRFFNTPILIPDARALNMLWQLLEWFPLRYAQASFTTLFRSLLKHYLLGETYLPILSQVISSYAPLTWLF